MKENTLALVMAVILIVATIVVLEVSKTGGGPVETEEIAVGSVQIPAAENAGSAPAEVSRRIEDKQERYRPAVELVGTQRWINSERFKLQDHVGEKVILVDFWTYSCINCQRTFPYLRSWWESYEDDGLLIVGVHSPEFAFEKDYDNVVRATEKFGVTWPVVQDNDKATFRAYQNRYWPRKYLIDIDGFIVYDHIGEGGYAETEAKIVELLEERAIVLGIDEVVESSGAIDMENPEFDKIYTPEIYFGYGRAPDQLGNSRDFTHDEPKQFSLPATMQENKFYLDGVWRIHEEEIVSESPGSISITYTSRRINLVAGAKEPVEVEVWVNDRLMDTITIQEHTLYELYDAGAYGQWNLQLKTKRGLEAYTFTFG